MMAKWDGLNMDDVYADWAEALQDFTLQSINGAIIASKTCKNPPNQGEFMELCKQFKPAQLLKIEHKLTPEQMAANRARLAQIAEMLAKRKKV